MNNEITVNVTTLGRCFIEMIDSEMSNFVDTFEDRIQIPFFTAIGNIVTPKIEFSNSSINAFSGQHATSVMANSDQRDTQGLLPLLRTYPKGKL